MDEQAISGTPVEVEGYVVLMLRDTFENWQSDDAILRQLDPVQGEQTFKNLNAVFPASDRRFEQPATGASQG